MVLPRRQPRRIVARIIAIVLRIADGHRPGWRARASRRGGESDGRATAGARIHPRAGHLLRFRPISAAVGFGSPTDGTRVGAHPTAIRRRAAVARLGWVGFARYGSGGVAGA